jgi:glycolate oxidase iron-sulfur subunit
MQTNIAPRFVGDPDVAEAEEILRTCVHCGFCLATCPTYQLLGDELDSPRGRIYLMKRMFEGEPVTEKTQLHLDRCLTCRSCETTCPSGVKYGRLVDIGRVHVERSVGRSSGERLRRTALKEVLPRGQVFNPLLKLGQLFRPFLPGDLQRKVPEARPAPVAPPARHARRMLLLDGCVQPGLAPEINAAAARVLDRLGISLIRVARAGCCGALPHHLNDHDQSRALARANIDAWWPEIEAGAEAIIVTASGCGAMLQDYGHLLRGDAAYAGKAERVAGLVRDAGQAVQAEAGALARLLAGKPPPSARRVAFQSPCTLQHAMKVRGVIEPLLQSAGYELTPVPNGHLCCGSAGTYSILQPALSRRLLENKVGALQTGHPDVIATANIGCLMQIRSGTRIPVRHWIDLVADRLTS